MEALDTNVIVRLATRDDEKQLQKAVALVRESYSRDAPAWISIIVLVEFSWVLTSLYKYSRQEVADAIQGLLNTEEFRVEDAALVSHALTAFRSQKADLADCLIVTRNAHTEIHPTHTFDVKASKLSGFELIQ